MVATKQQKMKDIQLQGTGRNVHRCWGWQQQLQSD